MSYIVNPPDVHSLAIQGLDSRFPVRRIYCVGRNYAEHAREMGSDPNRSSPFFFMKPADCIVEDGGVAPYPPQTADLHHEVELVLALGKDGTDIAEADALDHILGYGVGIDLTRRDLQAAAKEKRHPWDAGKGFRHSAPMSTLALASDIGHPDRGAIRLWVGETLRQQGDLNQMIWSAPEIVAFLSRLFPLEAGDLIMTGTPSGVAAVGPGDALRCEIEGVGSLAVTIG